MIDQVAELTTEPFFGADEIVQAYDWNTVRVAPEPTEERPGSTVETFYAEFARSMLENEPALNTKNLDPGQVEIPSAGTVWRTYGYMTNCRPRTATSPNS